MLADNAAALGLRPGPQSDPRQLFASALALEAEGNVAGAATVYDLAYGLDPTAADIAKARRRVLDRLAIVDHDLVFRYIPGGAFLMGTDSGEDLDERPAHRVWLSPYWLSETPISWSDFCRLMDWEPPPNGFPRHWQERPKGEFDPVAFALYNDNKIRLQYCEDQTQHAGDWHAHAPQLWQHGGRTTSAQEVFGTPPRDPADAPWEYGAKPMVAVPWQTAVDLAMRLSVGPVRFALPTEAQWEKAARGGRIGSRHAWGDEPPSRDRCDFGRFADFSILPMKTFPPNGYGLHAMNGGVWEWTREWYDRNAYRHSADTDPEGPAEGQEKLLRGGSWSDCAEVQTVSFRMSRDPARGYAAPNIGFRLCRATVDDHAWANGRK